MIKKRNQKSKKKLNKEEMAMSRSISIMDQVHL